jgi:hypothetical protein
MSPFAFEANSIGCIVKKSTFSGEHQFLRMDMKEELISSIAEVLQEWNPLGDAASSYNDLEGYRYEAMDILSAGSITKASIQKTVSTLLSQAFDLVLDEAQVKFYSKKIVELINEH